MLGVNGSLSDLTVELSQPVTMRAYDVFSKPSETGALKVVLSRE